MAKNKSQEEVVVEVAEVEAAAEPSAEDLAIRAAFDTNSGSDEEVIKMAMLNAGAKIKSVTRLFTEFMVDSGALASKEEKADALKANLEGVSLETEDEFNAAVELIVAEVTGATELSAAAMVRKYAKDTEVECYKKPAGAGRHDGFRFKFYTALRANPAMTAKEALEFGKTNGASDNDIKAFTHYQAIRELINEISGNAVVEDEAEAA